MHGHRGEHAIVPGGRLRRPARRRDVVGDRDHPRHARALGPVHHGPNRLGILGTTGIQVRVRVHHRRRQTLRHRWQLRLTRESGMPRGYSRTPCVAGRSRARSRSGAQSGPVSASFGSSLANSGVGFASGLPTSIGVDCPPGLLGLVVAGDDRVVGRALDVAGRRPRASPAAPPTCRCRRAPRAPPARMRQERREQRVHVRNHLQRGVQDGVAALRVVLALPRLLVGEVLVGRRRDPHRLADRRPGTASAPGARRRCRSALARQRLQLGVGLLRRGRLRHRADVLVRHRHRPVDQVAPLVGQLEVRPAGRTRPR